MKRFLIVNVYAAMPGNGNDCAPNLVCGRSLFEMKLPMPSREECQQIVAEGPLGGFAFCQEIAE